LSRSGPSMSIAHRPIRHSQSAMELSRVPVPSSPTNSQFAIRNSQCSSCCLLPTAFCLVVASRFTFCDSRRLALRFPDSPFLPCGSALGAPFPRFPDSPFHSVPCPSVPQNEQVNVGNNVPLYNVPLYERRTSHIAWSEPTQVNVGNNVPHYIPQFAIRRSQFEIQGRSLSPFPRFSVSLSHLPWKVTKVAASPITKKQCPLFIAAEGGNV